MYSCQHLFCVICPLPTLFIISSTLLQRLNFIQFCLTILDIISRDVGVLSYVYRLKYFTCIFSNSFQNLRSYINAIDPF